jgi:hypothetical protein
VLAEPKGLGDALAYPTAFTPSHFEGIRQRIDPDWISEALHATGTATVRRRRLPAEHVVWLVLGMALMRDKPLAEIVDRPDLALPTSRGDVMASSGVSQAAIAARCRAHRVAVHEKRRAMGACQR